jgi:selenocysteine-specific elongation factor
LVGEDVLRALIDLGELIQVQPDVLFDARTYEELIAGTLALIDADGTVSAKTLRDKFNTSRKYAIGLLEHLDSVGITRRVGDDRVRGKNAPS